jgi:hypothetical protein
VAGLLPGRLKRDALPSCGILSAAENCGSGFFLISLLLKNLQKLVWEKVKELQRLGGGD